MCSGASLREQIGRYNFSEVDGVGVLPGCAGSLRIKFSWISPGMAERSCFRRYSTLHSRVRGSSSMAGTETTWGACSVRFSALILSVSRPEREPQKLRVDGTGFSQGMLTVNSGFWSRSSLVYRLSRTKAVK